MLPDYEKGLAPEEQGATETERGLSTAQHRQPAEVKSERDIWLECFERRKELETFVNHLRPLAFSWKFRKKVEGKWPGFFAENPRRILPPADSNLLHTRGLDRTRVVALLDAVHPKR